MSKKILTALLSSFTTLVFANTESDLPVSEKEDQASVKTFQGFDKRFSAGIVYQAGSLENKIGNSGGYNATSSYLELERLFDNHAWMSAEISMMMSYGAYGNINATEPGGAPNPVGLDPALGTLNIKGGYAIQAIPNKLQVTPYGLIGRNTNATANAINNTNKDHDGTFVLENFTNQYFLTTGIGARAEWVVAKPVLVYFDQGLLYNFDMSTPSAGYNNANNYTAISTIGIKYNVWKQLQVGANANYSYMHNTDGVGSKQILEMYPNGAFGVGANIGFTY